MKTAQPTKKLGRGLSALLGDSKAGKAETALYQRKPIVTAAEIEPIKIKQIIAGTYQPRKYFDETALKELSDSIKVNGLIQPIVLRKSDDDKYEIIAGERRYRATKMLGKETINAIVKKVNNHEALEMAIVENIQRSDLSLIEEAKGYQQLMDEFSYTQEQVATKTGKSRSHIANILRLLDLPLEVQLMVDQKKLSLGHAKTIAASQNPAKIAHKIANENLTVRDAEELIRDEKIERLKQDPVVARHESKVKFVNSGELTDLENRLSSLMDSNVRISFNQFKNTGKITINFEDLETAYSLAERLES